MALVDDTNGTAQSDDTRVLRFGGGAERMTIESHQFNSTNVQSATWDPDSKQLEVTFVRDGSTYTYDDVPKDVWDGFKGASSPGRYLQNSIAPFYA